MQINNSNNKEEVYINNNEDNRNHFFLNLSHLLLKEILSKLDDCLDLICFSLVCKRFFQERNNYLEFNKSTLGLRFIKPIEYLDKQIKIKNLTTFFTDASINNYNLKSYHYQIQNTQVNDDEESILFFYENGEERTSFLDLHSTDRYNYKEILKNNKKVYFTCQQPSLESYLEDIKKVDGFATSNVSMAIKTKSISNLINIKVLPSFIKYIELRDTQYHPFPIECLPSCLEALTLGSSYDAIVDLAQLPTTLKYLCLRMRYYEPIESLPKSLEELRLENDYDFVLDETILPATLHTLIGISNRMAPGAYRSLKKLFISFIEYDHLQQPVNLIASQATPIDVIEIPPFVEELSFTSHFKIPDISRTLKLPITSLTKLTLDLFEIDDSTLNNIGNSNNNNNTGFIPSSVVYLNLSIQIINQTTPFSISRLLKSPNTSQLKKLILAFYTDPSLDSNSFTFGRREDGIGLDSLHFYFSIKKQLTEGIVPNGIKEFTPPIEFHDASSLSPTFIPSSVEKLDILFYANPFKIPYFDDDMAAPYDYDEDTVDINEDYNTVGANDDSDMNDTFDDIIDNTNFSTSTTITKTINIVSSNVRHINIHGSALLKCYDCIPITIKSFTVKNDDQDYHFRRLDKNHFIMMSDNHLHFKPRCGIIKESIILKSKSLFHNSFK